VEIPASRAMSLIVPERSLLGENYQGRIEDGPAFPFVIIRCCHEIRSISFRYIIERSINVIR
jgi:hypothetical protein